MANETCPVHLAPLDTNGECQWCRLAQKLPPKLAPYTLTPTDITFLRSLRIGTEVEATDFTADTGGD